MFFKRLFLFLVVLFTGASFTAIIDPAPRDISPVFYSDTSDIVISWTRKFYTPADSSAVFSKDAALHGEYGINLTKEIRDFVYLSAKTGFKNDFWLRFYLKYDLPAGTVISDSNFLVDVLRLTFFEKLQKDQPGDIVIFRLNPLLDNTGRFDLTCNIFPRADKVPHYAFRIPVAPLQSHCLEAHIRCPESDSMFLDLYLNGVFLRNIRYPYIFPKSFIGIGLATDKAESLDGHLSVDLDDISISTKRLTPLPPKPMVIPAVVESCSVTLGCAPFSSIFAGEELLSVRYQVFSNTMQTAPLFDMSAMDKALFVKFTVPVELDSGVYTWRAAFKNQHGNWSDWTEKERFVIRHQRPLLMRINSIFISKIKSRTPLTEIEAGQWYDLHVVYAETPNFPKGPEGGKGYLLVSLHNEEYSEGNSTNKGGRFLEKQNYVFNVSFDLKYDDTLKLFEKAKENSIQSESVGYDKAGLYVDGGKMNTLVDTLHHEFRIRMKLLDSAKAGRWILSGYIGASQGDNTKEKLSNTFSIPILVEQYSRTSWACWIVFFTAATGLGLLFFRRLKLTAANRMVEGLSLDNDGLSAYIIDHISEKILVQNVMKDLKLSRTDFYNLLKKNKITSLPEYVNLIRIKKAKEMLISTEKTISEINFSLGYEGTNYFNRVFKEFEHCTPLEYRMKMAKSGRPDKT